MFLHGTLISCVKFHKRQTNNSRWKLSAKKEREQKNFFRFLKLHYQKFTTSYIYRIYFFNWVRVPMSHRKESEREREKRADFVYEDKYENCLILINLSVCCVENNLPASLRSNVCVYVCILFWSLKRLPLFPSCRQKFRIKMKILFTSSYSSPFSLLNIW